jgi:hypothetical protein
MYLPRSRLPTVAPGGVGSYWACVRTTIETGSGLARTDIHLGRGVLNPC